MSLIRIYMDEDTVRKALVQAMRNAGVDVLTTSDAKNSGFTLGLIGSLYAI